MPRLSKIGAAALAAFGWTSGSAVTASYLVVAGGGGGGGIFATYGGGGGGGAGGYRTGTVSLNPTLSYTVTVGAGGSAGTSAPAKGGNGNDSVLSTITSTGGGGAGSGGVGTVTGNNGGSGGGAANDGTNPNAGGSGNTPSTSPSQGNNGGSTTSPYAPNYSGAGGGGASAAGANSTSTTGGNGGAGSASSISGSSVTYAGGGGGGTYNGGTRGTGGSGGGGNAGTAGGNNNGSAGTANLGGGGGGGSASTGASNGGQGGSGVVIISYVGAQQFGGGVVTSSGGNTIHTFNTSGTLSPLSSLTASYLIVAGGGGGSIGGGGAGGLLTGSGVTIDTNSTYLVTVGAGGAGATTDGQSSSGANSSFSMVATTAVGGGGAGGYSTTAGLRDGLSGGSGGGGGARSGVGSGTGGAATSGQGNIGGNGFNNGVGGSPGGGGGGAGAVGGNGANVSIGGNGGIGLASSISGTSTYYAGGGGGGATGTQGTGGLGGGGAGVASGTPNAGTANRGGGGGGNFNIPPDVGGAGGSGVVIISYAGSTQQMAGGTVTVAGGNVIHTFTSSGYLTPIVLVNKSLRFRKSASASLTRTPTAVGNTKTFTFSTWLKRGQISSDHSFFTSGNAAPNPRASFEFITATDALYISFNNGSGWVGLTTSAVYRDPSAWYHIVVAVDTTQATASNRVKLYVNGSQVTAFSSATYPNQNDDTSFNTTVPQALGYYIPSPSQYFDGYMTEVYMIDGQALTPNSFGTFNGLGVWQPIRYGGSYGTNGFYLPFTNTTSTTTLVADSSPNGNNWTPNNISLTAGTTYDSMTDVPTLTSATAANYATLNPLDIFYNTATTTVTNGNLTFTASATSGGASVRASMALTSGKFYYEAVLTSSITSSSTQTAWGLATSSYASSWGGTGSWGIVLNDSSIRARRIFNQGTTTNITDNTNVTATAILQCFVDTSTGNAWFGINNTWYDSSGGTTGNPSAGTNPTVTSVSGTVFPYLWAYGQNPSINFGQRPFTYTPPTGFVALNTFNLPTPTIGATASTTANEYFDATTYTGTGSSLSITNSGAMQPDLVWIKIRSQSFDHTLVDAVRGTSKDLESNTTGSEQTRSTVTAFNSNGFTVGTDSQVNSNGNTFVAWQWRASNATAVTNTSGSITSTVSANTTAGFSIVTYTGTGSAATVGHGLGVAPKMIIVKSRSAAGTDWPVYHASLGATGIVALDATIAFTVTSTPWSNTAPTSSVFTVGTSGDTNLNTRTYVAYCFSEVAGYSAFGSYTGNGSSNGPFVFIGFRPRFVMWKRTDSVNDWYMIDTSRSPYNEAINPLAANLSSQESSLGTNIDFLSNGFKPRQTGGHINASGGTYIYMAFAESPFKYANAR
jgi:hypothetical protein